MGTFHVDVDVLIKKKLIKNNPPINQSCYTFRCGMRYFKILKLIQSKDEVVTIIFKK